MGKSGTSNQIVLYVNIADIYQVYLLTKKILGISCFVLSFINTINVLK